MTFFLIGEAPIDATSARNAPPELAGLRGAFVDVNADRIPGLDLASLARQIEEHFRSRGLKAKTDRSSETLSFSEPVRPARNPRLFDFHATTWQETELSSVPKDGAAEEAIEKVLRLVDGFADTVVSSTSVYASIRRIGRR